MTATVTRHTVDVEIDDRTTRTITVVDLGAIGNYRTFRMECGQCGVGHLPGWPGTEAPCDTIVDAEADAFAREHVCWDGE